MLGRTIRDRRTRAPIRWLVPGLIAAVLVLGASGAAAVDSTPSDFRAVVPVRVFDTRTGTGGVPAAPLGPATALSVAIAGTNGIPADAKAVSLNVTVVGGTTSSYLTVWPNGDTRPFASNLNWTGPNATPNAVTVGVGTAGKASFYNDAGSVHVFADIVGYYSATLASGYERIESTRSAAAGAETDGTVACRLARRCWAAGSWAAAGCSSTPRFPARPGLASVGQEPLRRGQELPRLRHLRQHDLSRSDLRAREQPVPGPPGRSCRPRSEQRAGVS